MLSRIDTRVCYASLLCTTTLSVRTPERGLRPIRSPRSVLLVYRPDFAPDRLFSIPIHTLYLSSVFAFYLSFSPSLFPVWFRATRH